MSEQLRQWLTQELKRRNWSHREFARQTGLSQTYVSNVLKGDRNPSVNFCHKASIAVDVPSAQILTLAGILPDQPTPASPGPVTQRIMELIDTLPIEQKNQVLQYVQFLRQQSQGD